MTENTEKLLQSLAGALREVQEDYAAATDYIVDAQQHAEVLVAELTGERRLRETAEADLCTARGDIRHMTADIAGLKEDLIFEETRAERAEEQRDSAVALVAVFREQRDRTRPALLYANWHKAEPATPVRWHYWGQWVDENGGEPCAVVEAADGCVLTVVADCIRFTDVTLTDEQNGKKT